MRLIGTEELVELSKELRSSFLKMVEDYRFNDQAEFKDRFERPEGWSEKEFDVYLKDIYRLKKEVDLQPNKVRTIHYLLYREEDQTIVAHARFRPDLKDSNFLEGGNIGYGVAPSERRKGYGSIMLKKLLVVAKAHGLKKVLVTCNTDNLPSKKIIEGCGGVLENEIVSVEEGNKGNKVSRYWIELTVTY